MDYKEMFVTGIEINYYFICKYKLWLFTHFISFEKESELVKTGLLFHEMVCEKESRKEINFGSIKLDVVKKRNGILEISEIKRSKMANKANYFQLLYYIYYLSNYGIKVKGFLKYPLSYEVTEVRLNEENKKELENIILEVKNIKNSKVPPKKERNSFCKTCAYYDFCWC